MSFVYNLLFCTYDTTSSELLSHACYLVIRTAKTVDEHLFQLQLPKQHLRASFSHLVAIKVYSQVQVGTT